MKLSTLFLWAAYLMSAAGPALAQSRFSYSSDGSEVTDSKTGLIWRRCIEGMSWSGSTCTGTAGTSTYVAALTQVKSQTGWRLPNVKELTSIVDRGRSNPSIDVTVFPATPSSWFWSSSAYAGNSGLAWCVGFDYGSVEYFNLRHFDRPVVRLVR